jgi:hypothetical protein
MKRYQKTRRLTLVKNQVGRQGCHPIGAKADQGVRKKSAFAPNLYSARGCGFPLAMTVVAAVL